MLLSKRWSLDEWSNDADKSWHAITEQYRVLQIDLGLISDIDPKLDVKLHQDPLNDNPAFKYITVPVPPGAITRFMRLPSDWRDH